MNRRFYLFGIFFTALTLLTGLFNGAIYFLFRERSSMLPSSAGWFVVLSIIAFIGSTILLRYYHYKKYWLTFSAGVLCILASICYFTAVCVFLITREQVSFASAAYLAVLGTSLLYAVSLIFSNAEKRPWLKAAGVFNFIIGLILVSIFNWLKNTAEIFAWPDGINRDYSFGIDTGLGIKACN
jgi:hypothetical protein